MLKRVLLIVGAFAVVGAGVLFLLRDRLARKLVDRVVARVIAEASLHGVVVRELKIGSVAWAGPRSVKVRRISCLVHSRNGFAGTGPESIRVQIDALTATAVDWNASTMRYTLVDGAMNRVDANGGSNGEQISKIRAAAELPFSWTRRREIFAMLKAEAHRLMSEDRVGFPLQLSALVRFKTGARWHEVWLESREDENGSRLVFNRDDIVRVSKSYINELTDTEIDLVADNPVRAPVLLLLSEKAATTAYNLHRRDRSLPKDAFRHVYWSYLLTREFGPDFSEVVTDAHEINATYETGAADRRMDLHNNAIGRVYAIAGVDERDLPERVKTDPNVQRRAE